MDNCKLFGMIGSRGCRSRMKSLLIGYHSQSGTSKALANAAALGAELEPGVRPQLARAWDAGAGDVITADGLLLVAAENSGSVAGGMKDFLDRIFYPLAMRELIRPYGLILSAGNDGRGAQRQVQRIVSGIPLRSAMEPLIVRGEIAPSMMQASREVGQAFAAGLVMGIF